MEDLGTRLEKLSERISHTCNQPKVALIYDWENRWAFEDCTALYPSKNYNGLWRDYYTPFWDLGIDTDIIDMDGDLSGYDLVVAPVNYMYRGTYAERVREYVRNGGTYVTTWFSGEVDESDLCFLDRHPLGEVLGIWTEDIDAPADWMKNHVEYGGKRWEVTGVRALIHTGISSGEEGTSQMTDKVANAGEGAEVLAVYGEDFYKGWPALTRNRYGKGTAYFVAAQMEPGFLRTLMEDITKETGTGSPFKAVLPHGVTVRERKPMSEDTSSKDVPGSVYFLQNFNSGTMKVILEHPYQDLETDEILSGEIQMEGYSCLILQFYDTCENEK